MFQHTKFCIWKEHAPVATCFGMLHPFSSHQLVPATFLPVTFWNWTSEEIQSILAMPLIINWSRPNNYGKGNKGNKTDQDTMPPSALCCHRHHLHHLSWPWSFSNSEHVFIPHISSLQGGCQQLGRTGVLPNCFPTHFCWRSWTVLGLKERAEKSSFLPVEGSGTHKPASKCVRLNCKQKIHGVQTKPRVQNHNSTA